MTLVSIDGGRTFDGHYRCGLFIFIFRVSYSFVVADVIPIETARARFLQIIIDHFITHHIVPTPESPTETNYNSPNSKEKLKKRIRTRDGQYEGDPRYLLPLTFVANLYETLIHEVNQRLGTVEGSHEKTMGVALEAAGGLYRRLVKRYPKSGERIVCPLHEFHIKQSIILYVSWSRLLRNVTVPLFTKFCFKHLYQNNSFRTLLSVAIGPII